MKKTKDWLSFFGVLALAGTLKVLERLLDEPEPSWDGVPISATGYHFYVSDTSRKSLRRQVRGSITNAKLTSSSITNSKLGLRSIGRHRGRH